MITTNAVKKSPTVEVRNWVNLTVAEETAIMRAYADELMKDENEVFAFLQDTGIFDASGNLTEQYSRTE